MEYWLDNYCRVNLKYNTVQKYQVLIRKYIKPKLGKYRLSTITSASLNAFITEVCEQYDFSRSYFKNILKVLKGTFRDACNLYGFLKYNPALTLRLPKIDKEKTNVKHLYTQEEIDTILNRFRYDDTFTCAFLRSCFTSMRTGEAFALSWNDIDLENRIIYIRHNVYSKPKDEKGRWFIGDPKTLSGKRKIYISDTLLIALSNYKKRQNYLKELYGCKYKYYHLEDVLNEYGKVIEQRIVENTDKNEPIIDLVFTKEDGKYVGTNLTRYPYKIIHEELGIKNCRFYDLRGSYVTKSLRNGVEIRDVADILGHSKIESTKNHYTSSTEETLKEANEKFEEMVKSDVINEIIKYE